MRPKFYCILAFIIQGILEVKGQTPTIVTANPQMTTTMVNPSTMVVDQTKTSALDSVSTTATDTTTTEKPNFDNSFPNTTEIFSATTTRTGQPSSSGMTSGTPTTSSDIRSTAILVPSTMTTMSTTQQSTTSRPTFTSTVATTRKPISPANTTAKFVSPPPRNKTDPSEASVAIKTKRRMRDCGELLLGGYRTSGVYKIYPFPGSTKGVYVNCDMDMDGGGWTSLMGRNVRGVQRENFDLNSTSYINGFGSTCGDNWIGLAAMVALTSRNDQQVYWNTKLYIWIERYMFQGWHWEIIDYYSIHRYVQVVNLSNKYQFRISTYQSGSVDAQYYGQVNGSEFFSRDTWMSSNCTATGYTGNGFYSNCVNKWSLDNPFQPNVNNGYWMSEVKIRNPFLKWNTTLTDATIEFQRFGRIPKDCMEILLSRTTASGVYKIYPDQTTSFIYVYCDMTTDGGGWTTILQRGKYSTEREDFSSFTWEEYVAGFGSTCGDLMMGLGSLHTLVAGQDQTLRIDLTDWESRTAIASYKTFFIEGQQEEFRLQVGGYSGTAGDSLSPHNGMGFTTPDRDNDPWDGNCAEEYGGGWWYADCVNSNLNGEYLNQSQFSYGHGMIWSTWKGFNYSIKTVEMRIRNINFPTLRDLYATV